MSLLPHVHDHEPTAEEVGPAPATFFALASHPAIANVLLALFLQVILSLSFDSVFILFSYSKPELGGLGLSSNGIAAAMVTRGIFSIVFTLCFYSALQKLFGPSRLYTTYVCCWVVAYSLPYVMNQLVISNPAGKYVSSSGGIQPPLMPYIMIDMLFYGEMSWYLTTSMWLNLTLPALGDAQFP